MKRGVLTASILVAVGLLLVSFSVSASVMFSYDLVGRVTTAMYDNGICVAYGYDANGNRTAQINTNTGSSPVWGTGSFGCFIWTP